MSNSMRDAQGRFKRSQFKLSDAILRFWDKADKTSDCWEWTGALNKGYGVFNLNKQTKQAHRLAYELLVGDIPEGYQLDHLCKNTKCIKPSHLEPVTPQENMERSDAGKYWAAKTHCPQGHEYSSENTRVNKRGSRECRACHIDANRRYKARKAAA